MTRKSNRTSNSSKEITYKDIEKALKGRDLQNLSYKDMYELEQLGFGDWLKNNVKEISNFATTAFKDPASIPGMLESKYDQFTSSKEGDWLGRNWGNVAQTVGGGVLAGVGALGSVFTGGASLAATGAGISMMSSGISGMSSDASEQRNIAAQNQATAEQNVLMQRQAQEQALLQRTAQDPIYGAVYADGGIIDDPEAYRDISITPSWKKKAREGVQYATDNALNQIHFVNVGNRSYRVGAVMRCGGRLKRLEKGGKVDKPLPTTQSTTEYNINDEQLLKALRANNLKLQKNSQYTNPGEIKPASFKQKLNMMVPDNLRRAQENIVKVKDNLIIPTAAVAATLSGKNVPQFIGSYYLGDKLADSESNIPEGALTVVGNLSKSERLKRIGGMNDWKQAKQNFREGNYGSGIWNTLTTVGGLYDSRWIPGKWDDLIDKGLETMNMAGDVNSVWKSAEESLINPTLKKMQSGGTINYEGQSHEGPNGGIPVDEMGNPSVNPVALTEGKEVAYSSDEGTYIFSDRLKYSDSKTFAQRAKDLQKKYELRAKTKGGTFQLDDPISKKGYDMDMQELIAQQEQLKEMTMPQQPQPQQMGYGELPMAKWGLNLRGRKGNSQFHGGTVVGVTGQGITGLTSPMQDIYNYDYNQSNFNPENYYSYGVQKGYAESPVPVNKETTPIPSVTTNTDGVANKEAQQYQGMHWGQAALSALPDVAAGITNLIRGGNRRRNNPYSKLNAPYMVAEQINLENERAAAREQANVARANTSRGLRAGAATAGSYMANMIAGETGIQRGLGQQLGDSYQREAVANAQMRQQAAMANQQAEMQARGYNAQMEAQNRAQADAMTGAGISQIGQGITGAYNQYAADRRHVQALNMQSPDYALYQNEYTPSEANTKFGRWIQNQYRRASAGYTKGLTPEGRMNQEYQRQTIAEEAKKYRELGKKSPDALIKKLKEDFPNFTERELIELFNQVTE